MKDIQGQKPWTKNNISNEKNNVPRTDAILSGYIAGSFNGGHNRTIAWKKIMAGERHKEYRIQARFRMLTPLTPVYGQNLKCTIRTYFVPNSRIWVNAEKYTAQKGGATEIKIQQIPNMGGLKFPTCPIEGDADGLSGWTNYTHTINFRDSYISSYVPRLGLYNAINEESDVLRSAPAASIMLLRGRKAIFNDYERNKEYQEECYEYKGDTVTEAEWKSYFDLDTTQGNKDYLYCRAKRQNSYYTDYRTELQGFNNAPPNLQNTGAQQLTDWLSWENLVSEARSEAANANATDWDIIAKIRGSKKLSEGKVQLLSEKTFNLNYAAITQNTYNNNENIREEFRVLGQQGAYSYTEIDLPLYAAEEFIEEGYIHVIATVSADSVFELGWDRNELNITPFDEYRPDLLEQKDDVIYNVEYGTATITQGEAQNSLYQGTRGFKRKFNELFKLPNIVQGDMSTQPYWVTYENGATLATPTNIITNKTFQFFELGDNYHEDFGPTPIWHDYTDFLINKNQAIKNTVLRAGGDDIINGQNQIFFGGVAICNADLPVNSSIRDSYTTWGEH